MHTTVSHAVRVPGVGVAGCHYLMVYGDFVAPLAEALTQMNVTVVGPLGFC